MLLGSHKEINDLCRFMDVWRSGQELLPGVLRWEKYYPLGGCRVQNCLQHGYSIMLTGSIMRLKLSPYHPKLDWQLLMDCLLVHDHGEGELGTDTNYHFKNGEQDAKEYEAFVKRFGQLDREVFKHYEAAFLLQFCLKGGVYFPANAQRVMSVLAERNRMEALMFDAVERWDYVLYAWEQYQRNNNVSLLVWVLDSQLPHLKRLSQQIVGFEQEIFPVYLREHFSELVSSCQPLIAKMKVFLGLPDQK